MGFGNKGFFAVIALMSLIGWPSEVKCSPVATTTVEPWHYPCSGGSTVDLIENSPTVTAAAVDLKELYLDVIHMSNESAVHVRNLMKKYEEYFGEKYVEMLKNVDTLNGLLELPVVDQEYLDSIQITSHVQEVFERHARVAVFLEQAIRDEYSHESGIFRYDLVDIESNHLYPLLCKLKEIMAALGTDLDRRVRRSIMGMPLRTLEGIQNRRSRDYLVLRYLKDLFTDVNQVEFGALLVKAINI